MAESNDYIEIVLGLTESPACKVALITLIIENRPMTTKDLNLMLGHHKTFDNYLVLFSGMIEMGVIKIVKQKTKAGITRQHFIIELDTLANLVEE